MSMKRIKVRVYCQDEALRSYLQRVLEQCGEIEVVFPPPLTLWRRRWWWRII
ncbi:MAG: hypothetical protein KatS3mg020_0637 [Fimbriimonadales bacterium]|nr:MAG: hypothetical protein KatS3mg019_1791 [Fimbriimonadales bacterium]GIV11146.1 MAG: hypothetical protein KatS3mg020_0637 [Fimbriimonadales bacterium]